MEGWLRQSSAEWQIVVTHFPPSWGRWDWIPMAKTHGIDLIITGHVHSQQLIHPGMPRREFWPSVFTDFLGDTAWIVSGGGGGITSEHPPNQGGWDDEYGFMDVSISKTKMSINAISHGGQVRDSAVISPRNAR